MLLVSRLIRPSQEARDRVEQLAQDAAHEDGWMQPCFADRFKRYSDYWDFEDAHRRGWEETCHFEYNYDRVLDEIVDDEEARLGGRLGHESRLYDLYLPLKDLFWKTWENEVALCSKWEDWQQQQMAASVMPVAGRYVAPGIHDFCVRAGHCIPAANGYPVSPCM